MNHHALGSYCAIELSSFNLPYDQAIIVNILTSLGFKQIDTDIISLAKTQIGNSYYRRGARNYEAPNVVDCSSFTRWLYGQIGIEIPRRSIQQYTFGTLIPKEEIRSGDLVFKKGSRNYFGNNPSQAIGHVAIATGENTIIHAMSRSRGVCETSLDSYCRNINYRGACRIVTDFSSLLSFNAPSYYEVQSSDDIRWIILQNLHTVL